MSKKTTEIAWANFFREKGIPSELATRYMAYVSKLLDAKVPIIFDFKHLGLLLGRNTLYLASVVNSPHSHYRSFKIKKRSGGTREITAPYSSLLQMQNWIYKNILLNIPVNPVAHGFAKNKSIITNAKLHVGQSQLLKIDLEDFFPSINIARIIHVFKSLGYPSNVAFYLSAICTYDECLPQGAPTSPILSNIVSRQLDKRLIHFAKIFDLKYSRYADDLTFSGERIPATLIKYIDDIIKDEGFKLNANKTRLYKNKSKRIVTGISVASNKIRLPRSYKRKLRQELHFIFKYGFESHVKKLKIKKYNYIQSTIGKVDFWLSIEPENLFAQEAKQKLVIISKNYPQ